MAKTTYEQFDAAFSRVAAYAILSPDGEYIARVAFKYPADGMGRLYCYFQIWGAPMARGFAGGCGYDKQSAAVQSAFRNWLSASKGEQLRDKVQATADRFAAALGDCHDGTRWSNKLESAGFRVLSIFG